MSPMIFGMEKGLLMGKNELFQYPLKQFGGRSLKITTIDFKPHTYLEELKDGTFVGFGHEVIFEFVILISVIVNNLFYRLRFFK